MTATEARAEQLFDLLRESLFDVQATIIAIIEEKAWEPLGYKSFADAWKDRLSDITIAPELRVHVIYQMFGEGLTPDIAADAVKGMGVKTAALLKRQYDLGIPVDLAKPHNRTPSPYTTLFVKVSRDELATWKCAAEHNGLAVEEIAYTAVAQAFSRLQRPQEGAA